MLHCIESASAFFVGFLIYMSFHFWAYNDVGRTFRAPKHQAARICLVLVLCPCWTEQVKVSKNMQIVYWGLPYISIWATFKIYCVGSAHWSLVTVGLSSRFGEHTCHMWKTWENLRSAPFFTTDCRSIICRCDCHKSSHALTHLQKSPL